MKAIAVEQQIAKQLLTQAADCLDDAARALARSAAHAEAVVRPTHQALNIVAPYPLTDATLEEVVAFATQVGKRGEEIRRWAQEGAA